MQLLPRNDARSGGEVEISRSLLLWDLNVLADVSDIFYFFSALGRGGGVRGDRERGGVRFLLKIPGEGGVLPGREGGRGGREGICRELGEGGLNIFFRGRNARQDVTSRTLNSTKNMFVLLKSMFQICEEIKSKQD